MRNSKILNKQFLKSTTALTLLTGALFINSDFSLNAQAATSTATITVSASIASSCTITTGNMSFGAYDSGLTSSATATIATNCTNGTPFNIYFNETTDGPTAGAYKLYTAGGLASGQASDYLEAVFGATSGFSLIITNGNTVTISGTGTGALVNKTLYGRIASGQTGKSATSFSRNLTLNLVY
jgi:spore coat protein U-like protein